MKNSDKILISAYLDNDLSDDELNYIEKLINENSEAKDYLNQMKTIKNELSSFLETSTRSPEAEAISNFVELKRNQIEKDGLPRKFSRFFDLSNPIPAYSAIVLLVASIGINFYLFNETNDQEIDLIRYSNQIENLEYILEGKKIFRERDVRSEQRNVTPNRGLEENIVRLSQTLMGYSNQMVERNELKFRGVDDNYNKVFTKTLLNMHIEKNTNSKLTYGSEVFLIKIDRMIHKIDSAGCYEGTIQSVNDDINGFVFCFNQNEETSFIIFPITM